MMKRALTLLLSAGLTVAALYATLGPRDYSHHRWGHYHHHHDCEEVMDDPGI
jgi:hypothetical protein